MPRSSWLNGFSKVTIVTPAGSVDGTLFPSASFAALNARSVMTRDSFHDSPFFRQIMANLNMPQLADLEHEQERFAQQAEREHEHGTKGKSLC